MKIELIHFKATDNIKLNGYIYKAEKKTKKILISIHGMATNCIKVRDEKIAEKINEINIDFMAFNNRGHDIANFIEREGGLKKEKVLIGTAYEEISECYNDIVGAIQYVSKQGYEEIYIMGHSLGSTKIVYTYNKLKEENNIEELNKIKGIILLSLVDIPKAVQIYLRDNFPAMLTYAKNMKKEKMEKELMPEGSFIHPISIKTFLRYAVENEDIDFARYSDLNYNFKEINNIKIPLFMRWGNEKEMILQDAEELCRMLKNKIENPNLNIGYIQGANHSYRGQEEILAKEIKKFLNDNK